MEPMFVITFPVQSIRWGMVKATAAAAGSEGAEVEQHRPASEAVGARLLMAVQTTAGIQQSGQAIHQTIDLAPSAMTARMGVSNGIFRCPLPEFGNRFAHGRGPRTIVKPDTERRQAGFKISRRHGPVHFPDALVQFAGLAATIKMGNGASATPK